jgi:hypothetical protein
MRRQNKQIMRFGLTLAALALVFIARSEAAKQKAPSGNTLAAIPAKQAPALDGVAESLWQKAPALAVRVAGGVNAGKHLLRMKAVYDAQNIYFLFEWDDPTESLARFPWEKQADGSWKQLVTRKEDERTWYEDKLALLWGINAPGFAAQGCSYACHVGDGGKAFGNMFAPKGELLDMWHWKAARSNPVNQADDQYLDDTPWSKEVPNAGRKSDALASGGYKDNVNKEKSGPSLMGKAASPNWVLTSESAEFADHFKTGDRVGGVLVSPFVGDRGDLKARAVWRQGRWTLELARSLVTGSKHDVQFADRKASYVFAPAIFDNAEVRHAVAAGTYRLVFK